MSKRISSIGIVFMLVLGGIVGMMISQVQNTRADMWFIEIVTESGGLWGGETSIAVNSSGHSHISYYDASVADLEYAHWTGSAWSIQTVDSAGSVGTDTSIALGGNEYPHISYWDSSNQRLKHANWTGSSWTKDIVDTATLAVSGTSIALDSSDNPHISYYDSNTHELKYAKWTGSTWSTQIVDDGNNWEAGLGCSIAIDTGGNPRISYKYDDSNFVYLRYARWTGSSWSISNVRQIGPHTSWNDLVTTSLALDGSDYPHISYYDNTNGDLEYVMWTGSTWSSEIIDSANDVGEYNSLGLNESDQPYISYYDSTNGDLKFTRWNGTDWDTETVDSAADVGQDVSMDVDINGDAHISYKDRTNHKIKYAKWTPQERPTSSVDVLPAFENTAIFVVNATAVDPDPGDTFSLVELHYKKDSGSWSLYGTDITAPFSWDFDTSTTGGEGIYQFYSRAQDSNGYWEDPSELPPSSGINDTWTVVDTTTPLSYVNSLPSYRTTVTFTMTSQPSDQNGIAQVELYYKKDSGSWQLYGSDFTSPFSWNFDTSTTGGDGVYQFYSRAQDIPGLWEDPTELPPSSGTNDTWTFVDTVEPVSNVEPLVELKTSVTFTVNATASDLNGIAEVELYYKKDAGSWQLYSSDSTSPFSWNFDTSSTTGDGVYQFYSRAQDVPGLWEDSSELPPSSGNNDTWTLVDSTSPFSSVDALPNYVSSPTFDVNASASDSNGIAMVELYYKRDSGLWQMYSTDAAPPFTWIFDTSGTGGEGIYQFYSKAQDNKGLWEDPSQIPPSSGNNDTWIIVDTTTPVSNVVALPNFEITTIFGVDTQTADEYGIAQVEFYYRKDAGSWQLYGSDSISPFSWNFDTSTTGGDGVYQFYSRAQDKAGSWEDSSELPPSSGNNDTWTLVDTMTPVSSVNSLPSDVASSSFTVYATASDPNEIAQVELYYKKDSSSWQLYGTDASSPYSWNFDTSTTGGDGMYQFYSRAQDAPGLWEDSTDLPPSSGNNDTWTRVDTMGPFSAVDAMANYRTSLLFSVNATASDSSGIAQVELYYKKDTGSWQLYGTDTTYPYSWNFDSAGMGGEGLYQFYSRAQDNLGLLEDPSQIPPSSGNNDTWTMVDTTTPTSYVDPLSYFIHTETFVIDASASDLNGIVWVELYYKRDDGSWQLYGTDSALPFSWDFDISTTGGDGIYQFYSKAQDKAGLWEESSELPPSSGNNDTWTLVDTTEPVISNLIITPSEQSIEGYVNISADITDNNTIFYAWINITYPDGSWVNSTMNNGSGSIYYHNKSHNKEGNFQFTIWASDAFNHWVFAGGNFIIHDTTAPTITNLSPSNEAIINESTVLIRADYNDPSGIVQSSVLLKVDDEDVTVYAIISAGNITYEPGVPLSDGLHTIYLEIRDGSVNRNLASTTWSFTVNSTLDDVLPPLFYDCQPQNTSSISTNRPTIRANFSDDSGIDVGSIVLRVDNEDVTTSAISEEIGIAYVPPIPLADGTHTVTLQVEDTFGNRATISWSFTVNTTMEDTTPPTVDLGASKDVSQGDLVVLDGTMATDDSGTIANYTWTFTYDDNKIILHDKNPSFRFEKVGNYEVILSVKDPSNNSASNSMWVNVTGVDSDNDGLTDYDEINIHGTDKNDPDTDGDGLNDGDEISRGTNPLIAESEDEDFLSQNLLVILLIVILVIVIITIVLLAGRKKGKPDEIPSEPPVKSSVQTVKPSTPPPAKKSRSKLPPPPTKKTKSKSLPPPPPPPPPPPA